MTRINVGIKPVALSDWHLIAEINELPRIVDGYRYRQLNNIKFNDIPDKFTLGDKHMIFFFNKLKYIHLRYLELTYEFLYRDLDIIHIEGNKFKGVEFFQQDVYPEFYNDYYPETIDRIIICSRIANRIANSDKIPFYYGVHIPKGQAIKILIDRHEDVTTEAVVNYNKEIKPKDKQLNIYDKH